MASCAFAVQLIIPTQSVFALSPAGNTSTKRDLMHNEMMFAPTTESQSTVYSQPKSKRKYRTKKRRRPNLESLSPSWKKQIAVTDYGLLPGEPGTVGLPIGHAASELLNQPEVGRQLVPKGLSESVETCFDSKSKRLIPSTHPDYEFCRAKVSNGYFNHTSCPFVEMWRRNEHENNYFKFNLEW